MPAKGHGVHLLNRSGRKRKILYKALCTNLVKHERIQTTVPKAKALKIKADRLITLAKQGDEASLHQASRLLNEKPALVKLFTEMADRYKYRNGGYTRIIRTERRYRDYAPMCYIEYVDRVGELRPAKPVTQESHEAWKAQTQFYHENVQFIFPRKGLWAPPNENVRFGPGPLTYGPNPSNEIPVFTETTPEPNPIEAESQ